MRMRQYFVVLATFAFVGCNGLPRYEAAETLPRVDEPDPKVSFWREQVHYPFPVNYAQGRDTRGVTWEVAYMDEYAGDPAHKAEAPVLVLLHGRGMNAGYWQPTMTRGLENGLRVIALDMPNYGKSIPGNLGNRLTRSLDDIRSVLHEVIVEKLNIQSATFVGHSLGGQVALGFALAHPEAVERLVLVASVGLEHYRPVAQIPLIDPHLMNSRDDWERVWKSVLAEEKGRTATGVNTQFYGVRARGKRPYFRQGDAIGQYIVAVRNGAREGNTAEYARLTETIVWDAYSHGNELRPEDPSNLVARSENLKVPVFLAYGIDDPTLPITAFSGNTDIVADVVDPFYRRLKAAGNAPVVHLYEEAGHFPQHDRPERFHRDMFEFIATGGITSPTYVPATKVEPPADAPPSGEVPNDIGTFGKQLATAYASGEIDRIMRLYHPEFRHEGRDINGVRARWNNEIMPYVSDLAVDIVAADVEENLANVLLEFHTEYGITPWRGKLIKSERGWLFYGNRK